MEAIRLEDIKDLNNGMIEYNGKKYAKGIFYKNNNLPLEVVEQEKDSDLIYVKDWFLNKLDSEERMVLKKQNGGVIKKETEKAYLLTFNGKYGTVEKWIPKSACEN